MHDTNKSLIKLTIKPATLPDRPYLLALRKLTMVEHLEEAGLYLDDVTHAERVDLHYDAYHLVNLSDQVVGAVKFTVNNDSLYVMQLQVHPDFQRRGLGQAVIEYLASQYPTLAMTLTVLKANPARGLYQRLGFSQVGEDNYEYHMRRPALSEFPL